MLSVRRPLRRRLPVERSGSSPGGWLMVPVATENELKVLVRKLRNYIRVFGNDGTARCGICSVCGQTRKGADRGR